MSGQFTCFLTAPDIAGRHRGMLTLALSIDPGRSCFVNQARRDSGTKGMVMRNDTSCWIRNCSRSGPGGVRRERSQEDDFVVAVVEVVHDRFDEAGLVR